MINGRTIRNQRNRTLCTVMALLSSQFNQISCKTLTFSPRHTYHSILPTVSPKFPVTKSQKPKPLSLSRAVSNDEWGAEAAIEVEVEPTPSALSVEIYELKKKLIDSFKGSDRGWKAKSETRAQIVELITQLEALNPTSAPTEALPLLNGKWILAYTSYAGLFPLLSVGRLPLVKVEEISQTIDSANFTVQNSVKFSSPLATSSVSTNAKFEIRSPKRVQLKFEEGVIGTPQITDSIDIPEDFELFGQKIDLTPFKGLISSVRDTTSSVVSSISSRPPLKIPISSASAESWLITTYLDDDVRISRGDSGSVFVFKKDGRPPLSF